MRVDRLGDGVGSWVWAWSPPAMRIGAVMGMVRRKEKMCPIPIPIPIYTHPNKNLYLPTH
jgi:hypothetical protein